MMPVSQEAHVLAAPTIPAEALENHIVLLAKTGAGKSNAAKTVVEGMLDRAERVCVIDPTGTWYGLRLMPNGKPSPYKVLIFGGNHADVQISGGDGAAIAEVVGTSATSCIIDTRLLSVSARTQFFTAFAETLLAKNVGILNLVIDEAHLFAPKGKVNDPQSGKMLGAASNLVSLGRGIGLRIIMISQRPAKFHNDCLSCAETLVAMRMLLPADREAVMAWVKEHADAEQGKQIASSLSSLPTGDAWIWSPQLDLLERRHFPLVRTKDTGRPPRPDEARVDLDPLQIDEISARLKQVAAEVLANDPRALKAEIATLKRELATANKPAQNIPENIPAWPDQRELVAQLHAKVEEVLLALQQMKASAAELQRRQQAALAALGGESVSIPAAPAPQRRVAPTPAPVQRQPAPVREARQSEPPPASSSGGPITPALQRVVDSLAWWAAVGIEPVERSRAAVIAGLSPKASTFNVYIAKLTQGGYVETFPGTVKLTGAGKAIARAPVSVSRDEVVAQARSQLGAAAAGVFDKIVAHYPDWVSRGDLADECGLSRTASTLNVYISSAGKLGFVESQPGLVRAADWLFP